MDDYPLTDEQQEAVDAFSSGTDLLIEAGAGAGKTSVVVAMAKAQPDRSGAYLAFNRALADEAARRVPGNVDASTVHSRAWRAVMGDQGRAHPLNQRMVNGKRLKRAEEARLLGVDDWHARTPYGSKRFSRSYVAGYVMRGISRFCQTDDPKPLARHLPTIPLLDPAGQYGHRGENNWEMAEAHVEAMERAWEDLRSNTGKLRFQHEHYLKIWALSDPRMDVDFLLVDEAQDLSPVMRSIILNQRRHGVQVVMVGDASQAIYCQPVGTMVRTPTAPSDGRTIGYEDRPIETLVEGDRVVSYNLGGRSFRKSGSRVSAISRFHYRGELVRVTLPSGVTSAYTPEHHCVAVLGDAMHDQHVVYLMRRGDQYRIGRAPWRYASQEHSCGPVLRARAEGADAMWVLSTHASSTDAALAEALTQHEYGIPGMVFRRGAGMSLDVDQFWSKVGPNVDRALPCLADHGRRHDAPLWVKGRTMRLRRPSIVQACNLMDGMRFLPTDDVYRHSRTDYAWGPAWQPAAVTREPYDGDVVSMTVEGDHTYIGDGIVTHNSFTGAVNAMADLAEAGAEVRRLTQSFRFGPAVARVANVVLDQLDESDLRIVGFDDVPSTIGEVDGTPDCILTRTNAKAVSLALNLMAEGHSVAIAKNLRDNVTRFAEAALQLQHEGWTPHPELAPFSSWDEVLRFTEDDIAGDELVLMVKLIEEFTVERILAELGNTVSARQADVELSTAHTSKGREWDTVRVASDFPQAEEGEEVPDTAPEELRLLYVAVTRAKLRLDVTHLPWLDKLVSAGVV